MVKIEVRVLKPEAGSAGQVSVAAEVEGPSGIWQPALAQVLSEIRAITGGYPPAKPVSGSGLQDGDHPV